MPLYRIPDTGRVSIPLLLWVLAVLFVMDISLTFVAVGFMGAIELNPLMDILGFSNAMILKIFISAAALYIFYKCAPKAQKVARRTTAGLVVLYTLVAVSNIYQLAGAFA